ncbi:TaqI-like C-terminal specificity domain-containing protein [Riemerella anatipestifer]|uniref:TaqI-like C-terminal specificity domain-containing protein n=1 Tax=Riemerella anatipestifer TaxID=34085 RepID=UPI00069A624F|nr:TaqI-like C-terminal specificity domain-containing protein [Riemerella anatipestifer]
MQTNIFGEKEPEKLSIEQVAKMACISTATVRNWIKAGYLIQREKGLITKDSFNLCMSNIVGNRKLNSRANKLHKNDKVNTKGIDWLMNGFEGERIGIEYENSLSNSYRNKEGIYYTPYWIVRDMFNDIKIDRNFTFLDPCCGSGNFIIEAIEYGIPLENVYGYDIDENAVLITKKRIKDKFGYDTPNIKVGNFLEEAKNLDKFDLIFTNPPWGKKIEKSTKEYWASIYNCGSSTDTTSLFMAACLSLLKDNGVLGFLVQEAFFNISIFEDIRKRVALKRIKRFVDYGKAFKGLVTKAQAIIIENKEGLNDIEIKCNSENYIYYRNLKSFKNNPKHIFNFWTTKEETEIIEHLYSINHITLENKAKWAIGIVTGDNKKYCSNFNKEGYLPIYKGSDITREGLKVATTFIKEDFSTFQQVAPLEMYQSKEKIIYKFISSNLCFYYDTEQKYILNSANLFIPIDIGITGKQLTDVLNSDIINWLFKKLFSTHKILRGDLELLPIHTGYFSIHSDFSEDKYLDYLNIKKDNTNGTYRLKK